MLVFNEIKQLIVVLLTAASIVDLCTYTNDASIRFASDIANHPGFVQFCCYPSNQKCFVQRFCFLLLSQQIKMFCLKVLFFAVIPANKNVLFKGFDFCCYPSK